MPWNGKKFPVGQLSLRVGIHFGDVEHEEGPPPDVYGDTVNIAARLESIAEQGDVAISTLRICPGKSSQSLQQLRQANKKHSHSGGSLSTGLNVGSKGMNRDSDGPAIAIKPFTGAGEDVASFGGDLTNDLAKYLDQKDWIDL